MTAPLLALALAAACGAGTPAPPATPEPEPGEPLAWTGCDAPDRAARARHGLEAGGEPADEAAVARELLRRCGHAETRALMTQLVRFQTVAEIAEPADHPELAAMAAHLRAVAEGRGLEMRVVGAHDAWEVILPGEDRSTRQLVFVAHADVVPVSDPPALVPADAIPEGWTVPAFAVVERGGRLYGRGTEDDKGPIAAVLTALSLMREAGVVPSGDVVLAMGTAEEHAWDGMRRYAEQAPPATHTICVDASFPVVVAQSGFVAWGLTLPVGGARRRGATVRSVSGGLFLTQIPDRAVLELEPGRGATTASLAAAATEAARAEVARHGEGFDARVEAVEGVVRVTAMGTSVHSSVAEQGHNALWLLAAIAGRLELAVGGAATMLRLIAEVLAGDHHGERLGVGYEDPLMGALLVAPTVLRMQDGRVRLEINMRRPAGRTTAEHEAALAAAIERLRDRYGPELAPIDEPYVGEPHAARTDGPLVERLVAIYRDETGDREAGPIAIRGGTYARLFDGAVSFGPSFPGEPYTGHGADEHIGVEALERIGRMLLSAALSLAR